MFITIIILAIIGLMGLVIFFDKVIEILSLSVGLVVVGLESAYDFIAKAFN
ncbi:hypothetical protein [Methylovorus glucosotrophus]|uniref:Uncharacterized protein n=1 Tax=Methylovorus glucosotrophus (strain SIP3-4) TaxID=582744 RepID=C6X7W9_METGS|nr:hypothetical protein [Methylovorus glucosotrophus]ACT51296.1 hypothetical protein Msip34_2054 [Methylovorus glucosotrophus SIP3-4]